jgi:hypothetical protein
MPVEETWLRSRRDELQEIITGLVEQAYRHDVEEREWIEELEIDGRGDDFNPATMVILGLAASELRTAPAILGLESTRPYAVHTLLARADDLRSEFAALGSKNVA